MREPRPVVLTGRWAGLEPLSTAHVPDLFAVAGDDEIWRWQSVRPHTEAELEQSVLDALADPSRLSFAVLVDGRAQGSTSYLDIDTGLGGLEIGSTWYARPLWATRVNPQCKLLLLTHAFDELGADRVTLKTDGLNTRSQAAIRKLGARYDGTLRHQRRRPDGTVRDAAYFSLLATEWPAVRAGLLARLEG